MTRIRTLLKSSLLVLFGSWHAVAEVGVGPETLDLRSSGVVNATLPMADGGMLIGGRFTEIAGLPRTNLARLNADGSVDETWLLAVNGEVTAMDTRPDGAVFLGGNFSQVAGLQRSYLALIHPGLGTPTVDAWSPFHLNSVRDVAALPDGGVLVSGGTVIHYAPGSAEPQVGFGNWPNVDATLEPTPGLGEVMLTGNNRISVYRADGSIVWTFETPTVANLRSATRAPDGGAWYLYSDPTTQWQLRLRRLGPDGTPHAGTDLPMPVSAKRIDVAPDGTLWASSFTRLVSLDGFFGVREFGSVFRFDSSGFPIPGAVQVAGAPLVVNFTGNDVVVAGRLLTTGGTLTPGMVRLDASLAQTAPTPAILRRGAAVFHAIPVGDGGFLIAGDFIRVNGEERRFLLRLDGNLNLLPHQWPLNAAPSAIASSAQGDCFVGAASPLLQGLGESRVVRLVNCDMPDAQFRPEVPGPVTKLLAHDNRLIASTRNPDGSSDTHSIRSFAISSAGVVPASWSIGANGPVFAMLATGDSVFMAGAFSRAGGLERQRLFRLSSALDGSIDPQWVPAVTATQAFSMAPTNNGDLIIAGTSTSSPGVFSLFRLRQADGSHVTSWMPVPGASSVIRLRAMAVQSDHSLAISDFESNCCLSRLPLDGAVTSADWLDIGGYSGGTIHEMLPLADSRLMLVGDFATFAGQSRRGFAIATGTLSPVMFRNSFE